MTRTSQGHSIRTLLFVVHFTLFHNACESLYEYYRREPALFGKDACTHTSIMRVQDQHTIRIRSITQWWRRHLSVKQIRHPTYSIPRRFTYYQSLWSWTWKTFWYIISRNLIGREFYFGIRFDHEFWKTSPFWGQKFLSPNSAQLRPCEILRNR